MANLSLTIDIAAPPDRVAAFFVPQRMVYWYGSEMETAFDVLSTASGAADFALGQKVRISGRVGRRDVALTAVVTAFEWGRVLEWRFQDFYGVRGVQRWEMSSGTSFQAVKGSTRVTMRDEYELPGWFGRVWDALVMRHAVARRDRADLAKLKRLAEQS